jgi:hypothetical protein
MGCAILHLKMSKTLSTLALRRRRATLARTLPDLQHLLRGSLVERFVTCGKPNCKCARGERHGPLYYLTVSRPGRRTQGWYVPPDRLPEVRAWLANYQRVKGHLEAISDLNRELLRRGH